MVFFRAIDDLIPLAEKQSLLENYHALSRTHSPLRLPKFTTFFNNVKYGYISRIQMEAAQSPIVAFIDEVIVPRMLLETGIPGLQPLVPLSNSLYQRTASCTIHTMEPGDVVAWHADTRTKCHGRHFMTAVYTLSVTVDDGRETLLPSVCAEARERGLLPRLETINEEEGVLESHELFSGRLTLHDGAKQFHRVPPLAPGVRRACIVVFFSEDLTPKTPWQAFPDVLRESREMGRMKRLVHRVTGARQPVSINQFFHVLIPGALVLLVALLVYFGVRLGAQGRKRQPQTWEEQ